MEEEQASETFGSPAEKLILVVDDDPLIRDLLELSLAGSGFQVVLAAIHRQLRTQPLASVSTSRGINDR